jgi:NADPH-dependent glutamate synthase beta subunit-like oxidoreductase
VERKKITFNKISEMPEVAVAEGSMMVNKTGSWRYLRPVYREKLAPCRKGCPLGTDIPRVISLITKKQFREAWELVVETNPLPATAGHACYHSCENSCTRIALDDKVGVQALERFLADKFSDSGFPYSPAPKNGRKVAVIGSGPAGLAAAWALVREGYDAEVFEKGSEPGGMLRNSIPAYKLSREHLEKDLARLKSFGVRIHLNMEIGKETTFSELSGKYDAVIVATGSEAVPRKFFPGESAPRVYPGLDFLKAVSSPAKPEIGSQVVVIGKGNTAVDTARSSRRLGAAARIITLCSRAEMTASNDEIKAAESEGIEFLYQADIIDTRIKPGQLIFELKGLKSIEEGEEEPASDPYIPESEFTVIADTVIEAQGEKSTLSSETESFLAQDRVFSAGDAVTGSSSIAHAMKSGVSAALSVLSAFGKADLQEINMPSFNLMGMNRDCFNKSSKVELPARDIPEGFLDFSELTETISDQDAVYEAGRCISCGVCNYCDNCMTFCPDFCIHRTPDGYEVDLDYCKGCGICAQECPRDVIDLIQEGS